MHTHTHTQVKAALAKLDKEDAEAVAKGGEKRKYNSLDESGEVGVGETDAVQMLMVNVVLLLFLRLKQLCIGWHWGPTVAFTILHVHAVTLLPRKTNKGYTINGECPPPKIIIDSGVEIFTSYTRTANNEYVLLCNFSLVCSQPSPPPKLIMDSASYEFTYLLQ